MAKYIYTGIFKGGERVKLNADITVSEDKGIIFRAGSDDIKKFRAGHVFTVVNKCTQAMTTPESYATYLIKDSKGNEIKDVPEWYLSVV